MEGKKRFVMVQTRFPEGNQQGELTFVYGAGREAFVGLEVDADR
jgi:hypothetical protein